MSTKPYYRKEIHLHLAAAMAVVVMALAACQPPVSEEEKKTGQSVQGEPSKGGHLIMAWDASHEPASLDGHVEPYQPAWLIDSFIADPLLILGPDGEFHPALATSWTSSQNADEWTFHLRDDVVFQDGTPFNAQALEYNIRRILDPETRSAEMAARLGPVEEVEIVGDYTVTFHYREPWVILLDGFWRMPVWSPTAAEKWGPEEFDKHLVGTGPFTLEEWVPNSHVTLERWEGYGGWSSISQSGGTAYLERVTINFIGEEAVLGSVVQTGDAHIAMNLPAAYIDDYVDTKGFSLIKGYQAGTGLSMAINTRKAPLNILEFRQALLYGTDQVAINNLLYDGSYLPSFGPLNTVHPCYWNGAENLYPHDPEMAKSLLEKMGYTDQDGNGIREAQGVAGVPDGTPLSLRWTVLHYEEIGEAIQSQWRELGIDLVIEMVPGPVQLERVNARDFDFIYERQRSPDPMILDMLWNSANDLVGGWAWTGFVNAELDETVSQLRVVPEQAARCELAHAAQKIIMDNALMIPTLSEPVFYAVSDRVVGFQLMSEGNYHFLHNTYIRD
jgi:peptide/nickel transport system substrate-binding protein